MPDQFRIGDQVEALDVHGNWLPAVAGSVRPASHGGDDA